MGKNVKKINVYSLIYLMRHRSYRISPQSHNETYILATLGAWIAVKVRDI